MSILSIALLSITLTVAHTSSSRCGNHGALLSEVRKLTPPYPQHNNALLLLVDGLHTALPSRIRAPKDHTNIRISQPMISGIPFSWALEPECELLISMWSSGPRTIVIPPEVAPSPGVFSISLLETSSWTSQSLEHPTEGGASPDPTKKQQVSRQLVATSAPRPPPVQAKSAHTRPDVSHETARWQGQQNSDPTKTKQVPAKSARKSSATAFKTSYSSRSKLFMIYRIALIQVMFKLHIFKHDLDGVASGRELPRNTRTWSR